MNIGEKLLELRKKRNLSQEEVADQLGVTRQTISKWETDQSMPDFDKIVPICELYGISADELLTGKKTNEIVSTKVVQSNNKKTALILSISIFIYFLSIVWIAISQEALELNEGLSISVFLLLCGVATALLVYHFVSRPKVGEVKEPMKKKKENAIVKQINAIVSIICCIVYFVVSFITMAWYITWIIWIVDGLICEIVRLIFMLVGDHDAA